VTVSAVAAARRRDAIIEPLDRYYPSQAHWTQPEGGLFVWATLPPYIDTSDLLAKALREDVAFVPGRAAYVDGRGRNSMRLNFSAGDEDEIREGIRRIGKVVEEQVELYSTLTGAGANPHMPAGEAEDMGGIDSTVLPFRKAEGE
jgi:2-aminoadipate transaminase